MGGGGWGWGWVGGWGAWVRGDGPVDVGLARSGCDHAGVKSKGVQGVGG